MVNGFSLFPSTLDMVNKKPNQYNSSERDDYCTGVVNSPETLTILVKLKNWLLCRSCSKRVRHVYQEMPNLPEEVVEEILSMLPVESLLRFKCVCKYWYALIKNPKFVSKHMSKQSRGNVLFHRYSPKEVNVFCFLSRFGHSGDSNFWIEDLNLDFLLDSKLSKHHISRWLHMIGQCNGIVALYDCEDRFILCNPATRKFRILPRTYDLQVKTTGVGFGYDAKNDDYKIVRAVSIGETSSRLCSKAEVFSLHVNSWKEVNNAISSFEIWSNHEHEQFFDGVYYWQARDANAKVLVSFDMTSDSFSKASLPDFCNINHTRRGEVKVTKIGVFNNESIGMFVHFFFGLETCIDVWVTKEFGLQDSWIKQLTIGPLQLVGLGRPLVFWKNDEELLQEDDRGRLISYNLATLESKILQIHGGARRSRGATTYMKTLVSINEREITAAE